MTTPSQFAYNNLAPNSTVSGNVIDVSSIVSASISVVCKGVNCNVYCKYKSTRDATEWDFIDDPVLVYDSTPKNFSVAVKSKYMLITITTDDAICDSLTCYTQYSNSLPNDFDVHISAESGDSVLVVNTPETPLNITGSISIDTTGLASSANQLLTNSNLAILSDCVTDNKLAVSGTLSIDTSALATEITAQQSLSNVSALREFIETSFSFSPDKNLWVQVDTSEIPVDVSGSSVNVNTISGFATESNIASVVSAINSLPTPMGPTGYFSTRIIDGYSGFTGIQTINGTVSIGNTGDFFGPTGYVSVKSQSPLSITGSVGLTGAVQIASSTQSPVYISGSVSLATALSAQTDSITVYADENSGLNIRQLSVNTDSIDAGLGYYNWSTAINPPFPATAEALAVGIFGTTDNNLVSIGANVSTNALYTEITNLPQLQEISNVNLDYPLSSINSNIALINSNIALINSNITLTNSNIILSNSNLALISENTANLTTCVASGKIQCNVSIAPNQKVIIDNFASSGLSTEATSTNILSNIQVLNDKFSTGSGQTEIYTASRITNDIFAYVAKTNNNNKALAVDNSGYLYTNTNITNSSLAITNNNLSNLDVSLGSSVASLNSNLSLLNFTNSNVNAINSNLASVVADGKISVDIKNASLPISNINLSNLDIPFSSVNNALNSNLSAIITDINLSNSNLAIIAGAVDNANLNVHLYASHNSSTVPVQADNNGQLITHAMLQSGNGTDITSTTVSTKTGIDANIINNMVNISNVALDLPISALNSNVNLAVSNLAVLSGCVSAGNKYQCEITNTPLAVSGSFYQAVQPVSGTFWQATQPVSGTFWQATQPVSLSRTLTATYGAVSFVIASAISGGNFSNYFIDTSSLTTMTPASGAPTPVVIGALNYIPYGASITIGISHASQGANNNTLVPAGCDTTTLTNAYSIGAPSTQSSAYQLTQCGSWNYKGGIPRYIGFYNNSASGSITNVKVTISFTY